MNKTEPREKKPKPRAFINEETCSGCEICRCVCPVDCIMKLEDSASQGRLGICRVIEKRCIGCTICSKDCPWEAITMVKPEERHHAGAGKC